MGRDEDVVDVLDDPNVLGTRNNWRRRVKPHSSCKVQAVIMRFRNHHMYVSSV